MIIEDNKRFVKTTGNFQTADFAVKSNNMLHLMSILRDQLYSDKMLAPIREYSCNAYDANIENNKKDTPIRVTMPNSHFPEFKIRDYGKGLTYDEMVNIFCSYGESTKRTSNEYVGQLGIGSKSGFAYGDNFLVTSYKDNTKTVYNCVLDKAGAGSLLQLTTETCDDPSGIEITIPVKLNDIYNFKEKAFNFYKLWDIYPEIIGVDSSELISNYPIKQNYTVCSKNWSIDVTSDKKNSYVIMGNIGYPIEWNLLNLNTFKDYNSRNVLDIFRDSSLVIRTEIGEIEMSPSRESLQYTEKTINTIKKYLTEIISELHKIIIDKFSSDNVKSIWDAKIQYYTIFNSKKTEYYSGYSKFQTLFKDKIKFNDVVINDSEFNEFFNKCCHTNGLKSNIKPPLTFEGHVVSMYSNIYRNGANILKRNNTVSTIDCRPNNKIIINETTESDFRINRAIKYYMSVNTDIQAVYLLTFKSDIAKKDFMDHLKFDTVPMIKVQELLDLYIKNKPKHIRVTRTTPKIPKNLTPVTYYQPSTGSSAIKDIVDISTLSGYYIYTENNAFKINESDENFSSFMSEKLSAVISLLDLKSDIKIYKIGPKLLKNERLNIKNLTNFADVIGTQFKLESNIKIWGSLLAEYWVGDENNKWNKDAMKMLIKSIKNKNGVFYTHYNKISNYDSLSSFQYKYSKIHEFVNFKKITQYKDEKTIEYKKDLDLLNNTYPMFQFVSNNIKQNTYIKQHQHDALVSYINTIDGEI